VRDIAWKMLEDVVKTTETGFVYSAIKDVRAEGCTEKDYTMEVYCYPLPNSRFTSANMTGSADMNHAELLDSGDA
jgi:hypothetical protein